MKLRHWRLWAVGVVLVAALWIVSTALAATTVNFDSYADLTLAENLNIPGVTFDSAVNDWVVRSGGFAPDATTKLLGSLNFGTSTLTITFDDPICSFSFPFFIDDFVAGGSTIFVNGDLGGSSVFNNIYTGVMGSAWKNGVASYSGDPVDTLSVGIVAVQDAMSIGNFTFAACGAAPAVGPGPDMVSIPAGSVVGTFTDWTPLHYLPDPAAVSSYTMEPGKSLWVYGLDASGTFYKVLLSGKTYWVPATHIGPTYDHVWNGTPLPTSIVE